MFLQTSVLQIRARHKDRNKITSRFLGEEDRVIASGVKQSLPEKEIASSPVAPRNDRPPSLLMKSGNY